MGLSEPCADRQNTHTRTDTPRDRQTHTKTTQLLSNRRQVQKQGHQTLIGDTLDGLGRRRWRERERERERESERESLASTAATHRF